MSVKPLQPPTNASTALEQTPKALARPCSAAMPMAPRGPTPRSDAAWTAAAAAYIQSKRDVESAKQAEQQAKETLVSLTSQPIEQGCGVVVRRIPGWSPDMEAEAARDLGIDLARHFGKGCFGVTITVNEP